MEHAVYQGKTIRLSSLSRAMYQSIYEASISGQVTCPYCEEPLKLYIGIQKHPYFHHATSPFERSECIKKDRKRAEKPATKPKENVTYVERNGFRVPVSRSVSSSAQSNDDKWKNTTTLSNFPAFKPTVQKNSAHDTGYQQMLKDQHILLDANQQEAVTTTEGPLLVLAGAGSGKTRVLTARTAFMIHERSIDPRSIMLVTFTAKAAKEMKERLRSYPQMNDRVLNQMLVGTFHSIFYRMVAHHDPHTWNMNNLLKWEWQKEQMVKTAARELHLDEKEFPFDQALQQIGYWKNTLIGVRDVRPQDQWEERVHYLYKRYEEMKKRDGLFDFDDMLYGCYQTLLENPALLARYQQRFRYFLIDEFQDINKVQYEIIKLLSRESKNLCVVGDDDQSIYAFRGSDPSFILNFDTDFPGTQVVTLSQNYRSTHSIVTSANGVIAKNKARRVKKMFAQFHNDHAPLLFYPYDEEEEATMIVTDIKERIQNGDNPSDFAILYRTHSASRAVFERLTQSNLPFVLDKDSDSFYKRRMVRSMLSFLRLSLYPNHASAIQDLVMALFLKQSVVNDIKAISILEDLSLVEALGKIENLQAFQQKKIKRIVPRFKSLSNLSPLAALEMVSKDMGFDDFVKKRGNEGNKMEKGSDDVRDLKVVAKKFKTIPEFLEHVDHMIAMNEEMKIMSKQFHDSIQLTTIHRAKGLEYKYVYVLGGVDGSLPHDYALESYRNGETEALEEERRLLYVAMTRAKEALALSILQTRRGKTAYPSRFIKPLLIKQPVLSPK